MTKTKTTARSDGGSINFDELPDARVTIDLEETADGWIAYDPDDDAGIVGRAASAPRAAEDYARQVAEYLEDS